MYLRRNTCSLLSKVYLALLVLFAGTALFSGEFLEKAARSMGSVRTIHTHFVQEKHLKNFAFPMKITGIMASDHAAGRFAWRVAAPVQYNCIIEKEKLTQWDADTGKILTLDTAKNPALRILTETLKTLFTGNLSKMRQDFTVVKQINQTVHLRPGEKSLYKNFLREISLRFSPDLSRLTEIVLQEKNGDLTRIRFHKSVINQAIPPQMWQVKNTP